MGYELRRLGIEDAEQLAKVANNKEVARFLRVAFPHPYTLQDAREYISYAENSKDDVVLGIFIENKACGCICARIRSDVYAKSCELGYWLAQEHWGKGIMTSAVKAFCEFVFENYDVNRIDAEFLLIIQPRSGFWRRQGSSLKEFIRKRSINTASLRMT